MCVIIRCTRGVKTARYNLKIVEVVRKVTLRLLYAPRNLQCKLFPTCLPNLVIDYFQQQMLAVKYIHGQIGIQYLLDPFLRLGDINYFSCQVKSKDCCGRARSSANFHDLTCTTLCQGQK